MTTQHTAEAIAARPKDGLDQAIDDVLRSSRTLQHQRTPLRQWSQRHYALRLTLDAALEAMNACYEHNDDGAYIISDDPNHAAASQIWREQVVPAQRALDEFFQTTMYFVPEANDQPEHGRGVPNTDGKEQLVAALDKQNGCSKSALYRALGASSRRDKQAVEAAFQSLCGEKVCRWEAPSGPGLAGRCWLVGAAEEAPITMPRVE